VTRCASRRTHPLMQERSLGATTTASPGSTTASPATAGGGSCRCTPMTTWLAPWLGVPRRTGVDRAGPGRHGARHPRSTTPVAAERRTPGALGLPFGTAGSTVGAGGFLLAGTPLPEVAARARQQRRPVRVQSVATMPGRMGHASRWPVPEVDDLPGLADCWSFHSAAVLGRRQSWTAAPHPAGPLHLYRDRWVTRPGAVPRLLESPTPLLRAVL
jgi:hypothetical protein